MNSLNFYQLNKTNTYLALCKLVEKAFEQKQKVFVRTNSQEVTDEIDEILWSYDAVSFLPHSKLGDHITKPDPIHISSENENSNNASYLFIVNTANFSIPEICQFQRTFVLFNNLDKDFKDIVQKLWVDTADCDIERKYWVEENKGWVLKT